MFTNIFWIISALDKSACHNSKKALGDIKVSEYFNKCSNAAFYDLTANQKLQNNLGNILTLGHESCLQEDKIKFNNSLVIIDRFKKDIRTK